MDNEKRNRWPNERLGSMDNDRFHRLIREYREGIEGSRLSRKSIILWTFVSILYIRGGLSLKTAGTGTVLGVSIEGITEEKLLWLLLILIMYYAIKYVFALLKIHRRLEVCEQLSLFKLCCWFLFAVSDEQMKRAVSDLRMAPYPEHTQKNIGGDMIVKDLDGEERNTLLFWRHSRLFGGLEYVLMPIIFPTTLFLWALIEIVWRLFSI